MPSISPQQVKVLRRGHIQKMFFTFNRTKQTIYVPQSFHLQGTTLPSLSMQQHSKKHTYTKLDPLSTQQSQKIINTKF